MNKLIAVAAAGAIFAALPAYASDDDDAHEACANRSGQTLSREDIAAKVAGMGYQVRQVERERGCYEVYAIDRNGSRVKLLLNAGSGEPVDRREHRS